MRSGRLSKTRAPTSSAPFMRRAELHITMAAASGLGGGLVGGLGDGLGGGLTAALEMAMAEASKVHGRRPRRGLWRRRGCGI